MNKPNIVSAEEWQRAAHGQGGCTAKQLSSMPWHFSTQSFHGSSMIGHVAHSYPHH